MDSTTNTKKTLPWYFWLMLAAIIILGWIAIASNFDISVSKLQKVPVSTRDTVLMKKDDDTADIVIDNSNTINYGDAGSSSSSGTSSTGTESSTSSIPIMYWNNSTDSREYPGVKVANHYEWWMDGYDHRDVGEVFLDISDYEEITYNNVSDGSGYLIEILDADGKSIYTFVDHSNLFNDDIWFTVKENWQQIHIVWTSKDNESNGCVIFAR
jgi:hypothetical protein